MLSQDIDNAATYVGCLVAERRQPNGELLGLQSNLRALAEMARQMEAQIAPGATIGGRTVPVCQPQRTPS